VENRASQFSMHAINFCHEKEEAMVGFPPHSSQRLQHLNVSFFWRLKSFCSDTCFNFMVSNPGKDMMKSE
jgi:hypothetical protein